jgi:uncharacterized protein (DUF362 family)
MEKSVAQTVGLVNVTRYDRLTEAVEQALRLIHFDLNKKFRKIAIKPNLHNYWKSSAGETTDPEVVEAIIDVCRMNGSPDKIYLVESDATVMKAKYAFKMLGYEKLARRKNVELVNLCADTLLPIKSNTTNPVLQQIKMPETLTKVDLFISVPKLKLHSLTGLTCALKNQFGCIPIKRKIVFHKSLNKAIAFINKAITPDLVLVDGIISKGKTPKRLNLIMTGCDPVAVDFIAAKIAGLNPKRIKHIIESENLGVGSTNVECVGDDWLQFAKSFPHRGFFYNVSRKSLLQLYGLYLRLLTLEGKIFKLQPAVGG